MSLDRSLDLDTGDARAPQAVGDTTAVLLDLVLRADSVEEQLQRVADAATGLSPDVAACGVTVQLGRRPVSVASSDPLSATVDELQYEAQVGPCLDSLRTGDVVVVADYAQESRWGDYPGHAVAHGLRSSLSLPLSAGGTVVGALNVYGTSPDLFTGDLRATLEEFASRADAVVALALRHAEQNTLMDQLRSAMESRSVIDQAIGVLMAQQRCTADEAFALLRRASQGRNRKVADIATDIITSLTGAPPRVGRFQG